MYYSHGRTSSTTIKNVTGSLTAGQTVLCTFTNKQDSSLAVMASFTAADAPEGVTLAWETVSETGNAGLTSIAAPAMRDRGLRLTRP